MPSARGCSRAAALYDDSQPGNLQGDLNDVMRLSARADQLQKYLQLLD